jgi:hypothetical protein
MAHGETERGDDQWIVNDNFNQAGEKLRLRAGEYYNTHFAHQSSQRTPTVIITLNGHPVPHHEPEGGRIVLGPGMRYDTVIEAVETW